MIKIFDFHTHSTLKPYHSKDENGNFPNPNHWDEPTFDTISEQVYNRVVDSIYPEIIIRSQSYLEAYQEGRIKCFCVGLYPLEFGFIRTRNYLKIFQGVASFLLNIFNKDHVKVKLKLRRVLSAVIGIDPQKVKPLYDRGYNYFQDLKGETENLKRQGPRDFNGQSITPTFIQNFEQLAALNNEDTLAIILSIEGVHSFISTHDVPALKKHKSLWKNRFRKHHDVAADKVIENIVAYKQEHPELFYVTFAHHFYNLFCGHSKSLPGILFNQMKRFYEYGVSKDGFRIIDSLLARQRVGTKTLPRVLIDTKHMSLKSRVDFHAYIRAKNLQGDSIPIIQSHTAVSGRASMYALRNSFDNSVAKEDEAVDAKINTFQAIELNLFDDEIIEIIQSDGLIGIMLDEKRILGKAFPRFTPSSQYSMIMDNGKQKTFLIEDPQDYKAAKKKLGKCLFRQKYDPDHVEDSTDPDIQQAREKKRTVTIDNIEAIRNALKPMLCSLFINQLIYIVEVHTRSLPPNSTDEDKAKGWSHICIGTDFDGVINPLDAYPDGSFIEAFALDVVKFWNAFNLPQNPELAQFLFGLQPEEIMEKIVWTNAMHFMQKYFSRQYKYGLAV